LRSALLLVTLTTCADDGVPEACVEMCAAGAAVYGACLEDWGVSWAEAGHEDRSDFLGSCETWAWEMSLLEADAVDRGAPGAEGATAEACDERRAALRAPDATCEAWTDVDWSTPPWEAG